MDCRTFSETKTLEFDSTSESCCMRTATIKLSMMKHVRLTKRMKNKGEPKGCPQVPSQSGSEGSHKPSDSTSASVKQPGSACITPATSPRWRASRALERELRAREPGPRAQAVMRGPQLSAVERRKRVSNAMPTFSKVAWALSRRGGATNAHCGRRSLTTQRRPNSSTARTPKTK